MPTTWPSTRWPGQRQPPSGEGADAEDKARIQDRLITAPMPWMTIGPSVAGCLKGALSGKLHADDGGPGDDGEVLMP